MFWLVSCLAKAGEVERAESLFDQLVGYANDLGLLGEKIDTTSGEQLGDFPQAFSHIGLIIAAWQIDKARGRADGDYDSRPDFMNLVSDGRRVTGAYALGPVRETVCSRRLWPSARGSRWR